MIKSVNIYGSIGISIGVPIAVVIPLNALIGTNCAPMNGKNGCAKVETKNMPTKKYLQILSQRSIPKVFIKPKEIGHKMINEVIGETNAPKAKQQA